MTGDDERWMSLASREAVRALGTTHPNPAVGCVIVKGGVVIGKGHTAPPKGPHAEIVALGYAASSARGATMYVTLEPCNHHGTTPPCVRSIIHAGIKRVVIGVPDPNPVAGGGSRTLEETGIETEFIGLSDTAAYALRPFLHWAETRKPYIVWKYAMTLDGKTASRTGEARWISGLCARAWVHRMRRRLGTVMVGVGTALADDPQLTVRHAHSTRPEGPQPLRIVMDTELRLPMESALVRGVRQAPLLVVCAEGADPRRADDLRSAGVDLLVVPQRDGRPDFAILTSSLGERGISGILLEGGGTLAFSALEAGAVNEIACFVSPRLLGGLGAPTPLSGAGYPSPESAPPVRIVQARRCGTDWLLRAVPETELNHVQRNH